MSCLPTVGSVTHSSGTHSSLCRCLEDTVGSNCFVPTVWYDSLRDTERPFMVREFTVTVQGDRPLPDVWGAEGTSRAPYPRLRPKASIYGPVGLLLRIASRDVDSTALWPATHPKCRKHPRQAAQAARDRSGQQSPRPCWAAVATDTCPGLQAPPSCARASRSDLVKSARSQHLLRADGLITGTHRRLLPPIPRLLRGGNPGAASFSAAEELIHSDCRPPRDFEPFFSFFYELH